VKAPIFEVTPGSTHDSNALERERARADDNARLAALLTQVVRSSSALMGAPDFEAGLHQWLSQCSSATRAQRASLYDLATHEPTGLRTLRALTEWTHDDATGNVMHRLAAPFVLDPTGAEEAMAAITSGKVYAVHTEDTRSPMREFLQAQGNATVIAVPIFRGGVQWGALSFDHAQRRELNAADVSVLETAAETLAGILDRRDSMQALLAEREQRIAAERERADDNARLAGLLEEVVRGSRALLDAADFEPALLQWLGHFGRATDAIRSTLYDLAIHEPTGLKTARVLCEWSRPGIEGTIPASFAEPVVIDPRGGEEAMAAFTSGQAVTFQTEDSHGVMREFLRAQGNATVIAVPIFVDGVQWGGLSFDHATRRELNRGDLAVLQTAADSLGAVIKRNEVQRQVLAEREQRIAAERERADDNARLAGLLEEVVRGSRALLDAADFEPALLQWLGHFGRATGATRSTLHDIAVHEPTGLKTARMLCEWSYPGVEGSIPVSFARPFVIDPRGGEKAVEAFTAGKPVAVQFEDSKGAMRELLQAQGTATVIAVPIFVDGVQWGGLSFDHATRRELNRGDLAVLQTAADSLGAVIKRNEVQRQVLAERERAAGMRRAGLERANASLRESLVALSQADDESAFVSQSLRRIAAEAGADIAHLFVLAPGSTRLPLRMALRDGELSTQWLDSEPLAFRAGLDAASPHIRRLIDAKPMPFEWSTIEQSLADDRIAPEFLAWHRAQGHRAVALCCLVVGERAIGLVGMAFKSEQAPRPEQLQLVHALSQPLALVLELSHRAQQLRRSSEHQAVLSERQRLAREIHDGIAQSFLGIQMRLTTMGHTQTEAAQQALELARHGLSEARRAVAALRPHELRNRDLPAAVALLLTQMTSGSALAPVLESPARWQRLPVDLEDHLFRIVQEAINNVVKHSRASTVRVELSQAAGELSILVADDGMGFQVSPQGRLLAGCGEAAPNTGFGLESMQQRARLVGAEIEYVSHAGSGTQVLVSMPMPNTAFDDMRADA
jgi:signal transduction histidine kinase/transcriptional regulator with GAF, ATPase, and Fis domain